MRSHYMITVNLVLVLAQLMPASAKSEVRYLAYSLREAATRAESGERTSALMHMGGMTRIAGMVHDRTGGDIILVGLAAPSLPQVHLDDLAVALRARLVHDEWPLVSIDPVPDTERTRLQRIRFDGHLDQTPFGRDFLACDVLLKLYSLQRMEVISEIRPYNVYLENDLREAAAQTGVMVRRVHWYSPNERHVGEDCQGLPISTSESYEARFWFYVMDPYVTAHKEGVFCIKELHLGVQSEDLCRNHPGLPHKARGLFSRDWTEHLDKACSEYPILKRLKALYDLVAVAQAIRTIDDRAYLQYLLQGYSVTQVPIDPNYRLQELYGDVQRDDGLRQLIRIAGGIELRPEVRLLNYGNVGVLRSAVLDSRPSPTALTWTLPLEGWHMPNAKDLDLWPPEKVDLGTASGSRAGLPGCSVVCQSVILDPHGTAEDSPTKRFYGFPPFPPSPPQLRGVIMRMQVSDESFKPAYDDLQTLRDTLLKSRGSSDTLSWPADEETQKDEPKQ